MPANIETLKAVYDAFNRGDVAGWFDRMDADVEWTEPGELPYGGTYRGHEGLGRVAQGFADVYASMVVEPHEFYEDGDTVIAIGTYRFTTHAGEPVVADFVQVWDWRDGKAVRYRDFTDKALKLERALAHAVTA